MHDQSVLISYDFPDTEVADLDDLRPSPPMRPRSTTEQLVMHVLLEDGCWHRRMPDLSETPCEMRINTQFAPLRRESLVGPLCPGCFTPHERKKSIAITANEGKLP